MDKIEIRTIILTFFVWFVSGFDLILLTLLSVEIEKKFFPNTDPTISILAVYGTLSLSLLGRLFGGLFFSRIADTHGRKPIVTLCLMLLSLTMILSCYIPSIHTILNPLPETIIPLLFILSRIIIGFFIGGVWPTAGILGLEIVSYNRQTQNYFKNKGNISKSDLFKFFQNFYIFNKYENDFERETKKLTGKSASMQLGFFAGYFIAASLYYISINKTSFNEIFYTHIQYLLVNNTKFIPFIGNFIQVMFPTYDKIGAFGSMSLLIGISGILVFILYRIFIPESPYWKIWKDLYKQSDEYQTEIENKRIRIRTRY